MNYSFPKHTRLKSSKAIATLFQSGSPLKKFPIKLVYTKAEQKQEEPTFKVAFSVPKRHFKRAVDRNYLKRILRESYRLQKQLLQLQTKQNYTLMFIYIGKEKTDYATIKEKMEQLLLKFNKEIN